MYSQHSRGRYTRIRILYEYEYESSVFFFFDGNMNLLYIRIVHDNEYMYMVSK